MASHDVADAIRQRGGLCHISRLTRDGISADRVQRAADRGQVTRVRTGWYAIEAPHPDLVKAVRAGGAVSCVSALRLRGAWTVDNHVLHVRMRRGTSARAAKLVRRHWSDRRIVDPIDPVLEAARCAVHCLTFEQAVAALDSAVHLRLITIDELERDADSRMRRVVGSLDARSESVWSPWRG